MNLKPATTIVATLDKKTVKRQGHYVSIPALLYTVHVYFPNAGVNRASTHGYLTFDKKLAERMASAINAGVVEKDAKIKIDVNGKTYVQTNSVVYWKHANAYLKKLGF